jgi:hypothetical protein
MNFTNQNNEIAVVQLRDICNEAILHFSQLPSPPPLLLQAFRMFLEINKPVASNFYVYCRQNEYVIRNVLPYQLRCQEVIASSVTLWKLFQAHDLLPDHSIQLTPVQVASFRSYFQAGKFVIPVEVPVYAIPIAAIAEGKEDNTSLSIATQVKDEK